MIINDLPDEILCKIFSDSDTSWNGLHPFIDTHDYHWPSVHDHTAVETRMRKAITLTCRRWWTAGISLLYNSIRIHRTSQLNALIDSLKRSRSHPLKFEGTEVSPIEGYGFWIRRLHVFCPVMEDGYNRGEIRELFNLCPGVKTLTYIPYAKRGGVLPVVQVLQEQESGTFLPANVEPSAGTVDKRLTLLENLTVLSINAASESTTDNGAIVFKRLQSLHCEIDCMSAYENLGFISGWMLPELQQLSLRLEHLHPFLLRRGEGYRPLVTLCDAFGDKITFLSFDNRGCTIDMNSEFAYFLEKCRKLETFIYTRERIHVLPRDDSPTAQSCASLRYVKICCASSVNPRNQKCELEKHLSFFADEKRFPGLETLAIEDTNFQLLPYSPQPKEKTDINIAYRITELHKRGVTLLNADGKPFSYTLGAEKYMVDLSDSDSI